MSRPLLSDGDVNDDRNLIDQRNDFPLPQCNHARFPSLSEFSDTPSVYSHAYFTPRSPGTRDFDSDMARFDLKLPPHHLSAQSDPREQIFYRDRDHQPGAGGLDLDDDVASVGGSVSSGDEIEYDDEDNNSTHRISLQGPRIRFHSRAPWETDDIGEGDESDYSGKSSALGAMLKGKASKADGLMRTLGRGTLIAARPSVESSRSRTTSKASLEASVANGSRCATYAPPNVSASTSLGSVASPPTSAPSEIPPNTLPTHRAGQVSPSFQDTRATPASSRSVKKQSLHRDTSHPYSNPELVASYASESNDPLHQVVVNCIRSSGSNTSAVDVFGNRPTVPSVLPREEARNFKETQSGHRIRKMEISFPTAVLHGSDLNAASLNHNTNSLLLQPPPPEFRWSGLPNSSTVTLISLQEAQARERSRSATAHGAPTQSKKVDSALGVSLPSRDDTASMPENLDDSAPRISSSSSRARSISAGVRATTAIHPIVGSGYHLPEREDSDPSVLSTGPPAGRPLRHKRSGFMRLFSNRGDGDKTSPPPVPSLSDVYLAQGTQPEVVAKSSKLSKNRDLATPSPPPSLTTTASTLTLTNQDGLLADEDDRDSVFDSMIPDPRKRPPHIVTAVPVLNPSLRACTALAHSPSSSSSLQAPRSAPSTATDFQGLRLRPVSRVFSAHFADFVANPGENGSLDPSPAIAAMHSEAKILPLGPHSTREAPAPSSGMSEEQSLALQTLQEQILSAKKAWELQIWELQEKVKDLQAEVESLRAADSEEYCEVCRQDIREKRRRNDDLQMKTDVIDRVKVRAGDTARFVGGS